MRIAIIGIGGLGNFLTQLIMRTRMIKEHAFIFIDNDIIEESNIKRQILFSQKDIGLKKISVLKKILKKFNLKNIAFIEERITKNNISKLKNTDIIIDCTDNIKTRKIINEFCIRFKKPWIHMAVYKTYGEVKLFLPEEECFNCLNLKQQNSKDSDVELESIAITTGIGFHVLKEFINNNKIKELIRINTKTMQVLKLNLKINSNCKLHRNV